MELDAAWLLLGLPIAFALGWLSSRFDLKQMRRAQRESPKAYLHGLNLLLNEQQDKAIDVFIQAVQNDPDSTELHFALGNLFRRRGEFERSVRLHEHLLARGDLPSAERERAQHALAQDYLKAGLFDRAEAAFRDLAGTFETEAKLALLTLYERSHDWRAAVEVAGELEKKRGAGSFAPRIAHYWCELALEADAQGHVEEAAAALERARQMAPQAPRPLLIAGQRAARAARHDEALQAWAALCEQHPATFTLVAADAAASALAAGQRTAWLDRIQAAQQRRPSLDLLRAIALLDDSAPAQRQRLQDQLVVHPTLGVAAAVLAVPGPVDDDTRARLHEAVEPVARPLRRYRCAACAFEAQQHFWQCPGCLSWDSYPPLRVDEL